MNARCFKTVFSEHSGCLVAVGEHACSQGKSSGESPAGVGFWAELAGSAAGVFIGALVLSMAWVGLAWSAPVANALPTAGQVVQGAASMVQSSSPTASQLTINQSTQRAAINWQSFDIGAAAKVQVVQPNAQAVLLNRVVGQSPSQIFGQLQANGHVILVNPNGVLFGKDGSVNAGSFTASTLGITDADFMAGNMVYQRNGSTAGVVNQGTLTVVPGGYVALLGASVSNEGKIIAPQGGVALGSAATIRVPVSGSGRIKLELSAADINASVSNTGQIVSQGGQVYMQALALNRAAAQVIQSGSIDTSGEQAGAVHLLANGGTIKVDGSITANSSGTDDKGQPRKGGDIVIGRDEETGVLARFADVSGAKLESQRGFVETSGDVLVTTGTRVKAGEWLLDPYNITIAATGATGTAYASNYTSGADSIILASDISANLTAGTSVTLATGAGGASAGNIAVNESIAKTGGGDATLTLQAHGDITVAADKTISSTTGKLNVVLNSDFDANGSGAIVLNTGAGIASNGGAITLGGGSGGAGADYAAGNALNPNGILFEGASLQSSGGNITLRGKSTSGTTLNDYRANGIRLRDALGNNLIDAGAGQIVMDGVSVSTGNDTGYGIEIGHYGATAYSTQIVSSNSTSAVSLNGVGAASTFHRSGVYINAKGSIVTTGSGGVTVNATGGSGGYAFYLRDGGTINTSAGNSSVAVTADSMIIEGAGTINAGTGTVTLQNKTAGTLINVGGADVLTGSPLTLGLSSAEIARVTAGSVVIGSTAQQTGNITVSAAINTGSASNFSLVSAGGIAVNESIAKTTAADATLTLQANGNIAVAANKTITSTGGKLNTVFNSNSAGTGGGIVFNSSSGITSNGGNITLGGGTGLNGSGSAIGDGVASYAGISLASAAFNAGGGNIAMTGTTYRNAPTNTAGVHGILVTNGSIQTAGAGTINLNGYSTTTTATLSKAIQISGATITGGSTGTVSLVGDSRSAAAAGDYLYGVALGANAVVTSLGGDIAITGYGGNGSGGLATNIGVSISGAKVATVGAGKVTISGTGGQGTVGSNIGVYIDNASTVVSSQGSDINIIGQGGNGAKSVGVLIGGGTVGVAAGTTSANVIMTTDSVQLQSTTINSGTGTTTIQNKTAGTLVNVGGADVLNATPLTLGITNAEMNLITAGTLKIGSTTSGAMTTSTAITTAAATGNLYLQSGSTLTASNALTSGAGLFLQSAGGDISTSAAMSGTNVSIDNTNGTINLSTGTLTAGATAGSTTNAVNIASSITATGSVNILGNVATTTNTGVNLTSAGSITSSGTAATINITSNGNVVNAAVIKDTGTTGTGSNINLTSTSGTIMGTGAIGDTTNKNASVTFTQSGTSNYDGAINAANFTKAGAGALTLDSWAFSTPVATNVSSAYTVKAGSLTLSPGSNLAWLAPASVNVENASTFSLNSNSSSRWNNTAFNFTGGSGGGTMNLLGNPIGAGSTTNTISTSGGTTNTISGGLNANGANVNFNLASASSGTALLDGSFAALTFTQNTQGGYGLGSGAGAASTVNVSGGGGLLIKDTFKATTFNISAGQVQVGDGSAATSSATAELNVTNVSIAAGSKLTFNRAEAYASASVLTGAGSLIQAGAGALTLTGNSSAFAGATTVNGGKALVINTGGSLGAAGSTLVLSDSAASLTFANTSGTSTVASTISGAGTVTENGAGGVGLLLGNNTYTGTTTITAGTLQAGNGGTTGSLGTGAVTDNSALVYKRSDNVTVANTISGTGTFTQAGTGTVLFPDSNAGYTGQTYVDSGKLSFGSLLTSGTAASQYWSSQINVAAGAILDFNAPTGVSLNNRGTILTGAGTITKTGGGGVNWNSTDVFFNMLAGSLIDVQQGVMTASASYHGKWTNNLSSLNVAGGAVFNGAEADVRVDALTGAGSVALGWTTIGSLTVGVNGTAAGAYNATAGTATFSGVISPAGTNAGLTKIGVGTQILTGANTYTGATTVSAGVLQIGNGGTTGTLGTGAVSNNSSLVFNRSDTGLVISSAISGTGTVTQMGSGKTTLSANNSWSGATTINAGTLQIGNGSNTGTLGTSAVSVAANANLSFYRNDTSLTIANSMSGAGSVNFLGTGVSSQSSYYLTGNNSSLSGRINVSSSRVGITAANQVGTAAMTIDSGAGLYANGNFTINNTLSLAGNGWLENTYGQLGALRLQNGTTYAGAITLAADARIGAYGSTGTVSGIISGAKNLDFNSGTGKVILTANNAYTGATTVSGGTLQVGNAGSTGTLGAGDVTLSNDANLNYVRSAATTIANNISGAGHVSATITGASSDLTVDHTIGLTAGTVNLVTDANLFLSKAISTTNTTSSAIFLEAGKATNAGTSTGGDVQISGTGALTVGSGGRATVMTGSVAGSTGLTALVGSGNSRYNSDEVATNYTTALGTGTYAIYREAPTLTLAFNNARKIYDAQAYSGGNGFVSTGFVNGDTNAQLSTIAYSGTSQAAKNAGSYDIRGTATSGVGYALAYTAGTLTVDKADLVLSGTRVYDASKTFAGTYLTATGVGGETFALTGAGDASNLASKNVQTNQLLSSVTGLTLGASTGITVGLGTNYNAISTTGSSVSVTAKAATVAGTATNLTYNGNLQNQQAATSGGFEAGDTISITGLASGKNAGTYTSNLGVTGTDAANYNVSYTNADLVIGKANLVLSGTRVYDGGKTFVSQYLIATGVNNEAFALTGLGDATNLSSKNVQTNQLLSSVTGLTLGASTGTTAGLSTNYNAISTTGSSVSVTAKAATVDATAATVTYNGAVQAQAAPTSSGFIAGDLITISGIASGQNAGSYASSLAVSGDDAGNYSVTRNNANLVILKAALTATGNSSAVTYNGVNQSVAGFTVSGLQGSDSVANLSSIVASGATGKNAGAYTNTVTAGSETNYTVSTVNGSLQIAKAALTATGNSSTVTYNGVNQSVAGFTVSGLQGSDTTANLSSIQASGAMAKNAGTYSNMVTAGSETNYTVTAVNGALQIDKANLIATGNSSSVTYNGVNQSVAGFTVSGLQGSDTAANLSSVSAAGSTAKNVGTYSNTVTAGTETNYNVSTVNGSLQIGKANLVLSGTRVYDGGKTFEGQYLTATGVAGESFAISGAGDASNLSSKNVQTNQLLSTLTGLSLGSSNNGGLSTNYNAISTTGSSVSVTAKAATVTGTATNVTYNGSSQTQSAPASSGFIAGDSISFSGEASGKNAGTYTSSLFVGGADAGNYNVTVSNADLVIAKAALTVTASQVSKTYDGGLGATGTGTVGALAGAAAGDVVNNAGAQAFLDKDAGTGKSVRASGVTIKDAVNADMSGNYTINYVDNTTSTINKAALTVTANADARFVTQSDAAGFNGVSYAGFVGGENSSVLGGTLAISRTNVATQGAGAYTGVLEARGLSSGNYEISYANGNYTIVPANQLLIKTANTSVTYGSAPVFNTTAQYLLDDGVHPSQIVTLTRSGSGGNYSFTDGAGGSVSMTLSPYALNSNVAAAVSSSGHTVVGNYDIKALNPAVVGSNFVGSPVFVGALTVDTKAVTPNATGVSKVYDATTSMNNVVIGLSGKVDSDHLTISGTGAFSQKNVGTGLGYTVSGITLNGTDAANYHLSGGSNSLTGSDGVITAAALKITTSDVSKTYDRSLGAQGVAQATQGTQLFGSDALSGGTFAFTNWNAGVGNKVVTVSGVTLNDGNGGANYVVSYVDNTTSTITPKSLTATYNASSRTYNGSTTAVVTGSSSDVISGDAVSFSNTSANFGSKDVGIGKTVTVSGIGIGGADSGNYTLQNTTATTAADISAKSLTASFSAASRAYNGGVAASVTGSSGDIVGSDVITFTSTSANFDTKDVGAGKVVSVAGIGLSGADAGNYILQNTAVSTTGTITPKDVSISSLTASNKVYDGTRTTSITSGAVTTGVGSETLFISGTGTFSDKNAGTGKTVTVADVTTLSKSDGTGDWRNYNLISTGSMTTAADITQAALTVTASAATKTYDGTLDASGAGTVGALAAIGDSVNNIGQQAFLDKNAGTGKSVRASGVTIKDASNADMTGNYAITYVDNTSSVIEKAALKVTVNNTAMFVTQDPNTAFNQGFSFEGLKNGESGTNVLGTLTRSYTGAANPATGSYASVYGLSTVPLADNYTVTVQKGDLTVVAADKLLINVGGKSETYGVLTASNAGASANTVVAQYCLVSTDCNGANLANLAMSRQGSLWTATDVSNSTIRFNTLVDTAGHTSGGAYLNAGRYTYAADGLTTSGAVNFNGTVVSGGVLTVDAKQLTFSASNVSKVYDGTTVLAGMALTPNGVLAGDSVGVSASGGTFSSKNAGSQTFSLTGLQLLGSDRGNYVFAGNSLSGTGTITPKTLSLTSSVLDKTYDGTTAATGSLSTGNVIGHDDVQLNWGPVTFASKDVSRDAQGQVQTQAVNFAGVQLSGLDAGNYSVNTTASGSAKITPKRLSVSGTSVANKSQDGNTVATAQVGRLTGLVGLEQLQAQALASFDSAMAGSNKPVTVRYRLGNGANGGLGGNYELPDQVLSASILARSGSNAVQPVKTPVEGTPVGMSAATATLVQTESRDACSSATPEKCQCHATSVAGMEICMPGLKNLQPNVPARGRAFVQASGL